MIGNDQWKKIAAIIAAICVFIILIFIVKMQYDISKKQNEIETSLVEMKRLQDGTVRSQSQYVTKEDLEKFAEESGVDLDLIRDDLSDLNAKVIGISTVLVSTPGYNGTNLPSTKVIPRSDKNPLPSIYCPDGSTIDCAEIDPHGYLGNSQFLNIKEPMSKGEAVPFGEVGFKAWEKNPWSLKVFPRNYSVTTVLGQDENGRHYTYHKFAIKTEGKTYPVEITDSKLIEEYPKPSFRFDPHISLAVDAGSHVHPLPMAEVVPNVQVSFFSYGKTKVNPTWTFLGLGVGYASQAQRFSVLLAPFSYNLGDHIPLIDNLYIGPSVGVDHTGGVAVLSGIRVGL